MASKNARQFIAAIILTKNEETHLQRAIESIRPHVDIVYIVDCGSTDGTTVIAERLGAQVLSKEWVSYPDQFNWAIEELPSKVDWVLRLDADEYLSRESQVRDEIERITSKEPAVKGISCLRSIVFLGRELKHGGMSKRPVVRMFRRGFARCDDRLIDEHIIVDGPIRLAKISIIDHCLKGIGFWIEKHNRYAELEAKEYLRERKLTCHAAQDRKRSLYYKLPPFFRAFLYFAYRFFILGGCLDGAAGVYYTFLQAFWYRVLVDVRIAELRSVVIKSEK